MVNILFIGYNHNILTYILHLKRKHTLYTYKSLTRKCEKYEIVNMNETILNTMDIIIVFCSSHIPTIEPFIRETTTIKHIFSIHPISIHKDIQLHTTIKLYNILGIIDSSYMKRKLKITPSKPNVLNCPNIIKRNAFEEFSDLCIHHLNAYKEIVLPTIQKSEYTDKQAVLVEFRKLPHSELIIRNCIKQLGTDWSHLIITSNEHYLYYVSLCNQINSNIQVISFDHMKDHNDYNNLLLSKDFWNTLSCEKILIYQSDSFIFKSNIHDFIKWDYIGAPFNKQFSFLLAQEQVGNGGLSLRSKSVMLDVLDKVDLNLNVYSPPVNRYKRSRNLDNFPEDIVFSQNIQTLGIGKVADFNEAKHFSTDMIYEEDSFGMHCMWNGNKNWDKILDSKISSFIPKNDVFTNYKTLFHKYNLNISDPNKEIYYECIKHNQINNHYICHYHIYDLDHYDYSTLPELIEQFNVVITFCKGNSKKLINNKLSLIKVDNKGYDIGPKIVALEFLKRNCIEYDYILFLHSKSNLERRKDYFDPLIKNMYRIKLIKQLITEEDLYGIFPNCMWYSDSENNDDKKDFYNRYFYVNENYYIDFLKYLNIEEYRVFSEGNCFMCKKILLDYIFTDNYKLFYNLLNIDNSFDVNWFKKYYNCNNYSIEQCFYKYTNENLYGNNLLLHNKKNTLPDAMIEHVFERLWINVIKGLNKKYLVLDKNDIITNYDIKINTQYIDFYSSTFNNDFDIEYYKGSNMDLQNLPNDECVNHFKNMGFKENRPFKYKNIPYKNMCLDYDDVIPNYTNNKYDLTDKQLGLSLYVENYNTTKLEKMFIVLLSKIILRSYNIYNLEKINKNSNTINVNAWNEQAVLEPNNVTGYEFLETISKTIKNI